MHLTTISNKKLLKVSYLISKRIVFAGEALSIAKNLIKSCMIEAAKILLSEDDHQELESIPSLDNTISRRIDGLSIYLKSEVYCR